jgi:hypothetical protein
MIGILLSLASRLPQRSAAFVPDAPLGTGLEWMTVSAVLLPALLLVVLVYLGSSDTV